jgi:hypothetical protein
VTRDKKLRIVVVESDLKTIERSISVLNVVDNAILSGSTPESGGDGAVGETRTGPRDTISN